MDVDSIRLSEELFQQITFLGYLKEMAMQYGFDISLPAKTAREAVQWLYFGYLGAIKEQNGAAMSLGRTSTFLDIYFERDLKNGVLDEAGAQELFDDFVMKLRMARHLRTPAYNELFAGDPMWITEALGGRGIFGVELFVKGEDVIFSEVSPRPHDTGMVTMITQDLSQFALHARAILGLPIPNIAFHGAGASRAVVVEGDSNQLSLGNLDKVLEQPDTQMRFFGKPEVHGHRRMAVLLARGLDVADARRKTGVMMEQLEIKL